MVKFIGGFFGLEAPGAPTTRGGLLMRWGFLPDVHWAFSNGRSALHHLLRHLAPATIWFPSYSCLSMAEAVVGSGAALKFYPIDDALSPDIAYLSAHVKPGDAVIAVDYFGRNPSPAFMEYAASRRDVHWIEDRAQAMLPSAKAWGDYVLYTPRKLLGVADGGIITSREPLPAFAYGARADEAALAKPARLRAEDVAEEKNAEWYKAYVAVEEEIHVRDAPMSAATSATLANVDADAMMEKRKANYAQLASAFPSQALFKGAADFVPMGFPIRIPNRAAVAKQLHAAGIFAAHHWPALPSPADEFTADHARTNELLTLPCDHRYGPAEMERVIAATRAALGNA